MTHTEQAKTLMNGCNRANGNYRCGEKYPNFEVKFCPLCKAKSSQLLKDLKGFEEFLNTLSIFDFRKAIDYVNTETIKEDIHKGIKILEGGK